MNTIAAPARPCCIAVHCTRERAPRLEAGVDLMLCTKHLNALRRTCRGKQGMAYAKLAVREAARLVDAGASRHRQKTLVAYRCALCGTWHTGHQHGSHLDTAAREAAAAVHLTIAPRHLDALLTAWKPRS